MRKKLVKILIIAICLIVVLLSGCFTGSPMREVPIGYALPACGSLQITSGFSESPILATRLNNGLVLPVTFDGLAVQFNDINNGSDYLNISNINTVNFIYKEQLYKVTLRPLGNISKVNEQQVVHFGSIENNIDIGANLHSVQIIFLYENYLYYQLQATQRFHTSVMHTPGVSFYKFAFFRFNLETIQNEEVTLEHFFEKLLPFHEKYAIYDSPAYLNPSFRIREN